MKRNRLKKKQKIKKKRSKMINIYLQLLKKQKKV